MITSLVILAISLIIFGALLYIVDLLPIDATVKRIIHVIAVVALIIWLLQYFGMLPHGPFIR